MNLHQVFFDEVRNVTQEDWDKIQQLLQHRRVSMIDVTSTDPYEVARSQGQGDPILLQHQCIAVKMREDFIIQTVNGSQAYPAGDYLVVNNQKMKRVHVSAEAFELLFDVRQ